MKLSVTASETYTLTAQTIDKIIRTGDGDAALLYLYTLKTKSKSTAEEAAKALGMSIGTINTATAKLSRMGLIEVEAETTSGTAQATAENRTSAPLREPHDYTREEVLAVMKSSSDFATLVDETARRLGKTLEADDMLRLYSIYDNLHLPVEVILQLITHCINECRLSGSGRMPSTRYIEKAACTWESEGIFTIERAEQYLKALEERRSTRYKIKRLMQIKDREFSDTEKHYVDSWITMGFEPEAIAEAYDRTIVKTGSLSYPYMDKILVSWHSKGLHTLQQILEKDGRKPQPGSAGTYATGSFHSNSRDSAQKHGKPNREQLERMSRLIKKMGENQEQTGETDGN